MSELLGSSGAFIEEAYQSGLAIKNGALLRCYSLGQKWVSIGKLSSQFGRDRVESDLLKPAIGVTVSGQTLNSISGWKSIDSEGRLRETQASYISSDVGEWLWKSRMSVNDSVLALASTVEEDAFSNAGAPTRVS